jgi:hypothetical protein
MNPDSSRSSLSGQPVSKNRNQKIRKVYKSDAESQRLVKIEIRIEEKQKRRRASKESVPTGDRWNEKTGTVHCAPTVGGLQKWAKDFSPLQKRTVVCNKSKAGNKII